jgi:hypothetical protein
LVIQRIRRERAISPLVSALTFLPWHTHTVCSAERFSAPIPVKNLMGVFSEQVGIVILDLECVDCIEELATLRIDLFACPKERCRLVGLSFVVGSK